MRSEASGREDAARPPARNPFLPSIPAIVLIAAAALAVFWNALPNGFHLDDHYHIVDNPAIRHVGPIGRHFVDPRTMSSLDRIVQYRPLLPLTLSLSYALTGMSPAGFRAWNLALLMLAAVLVYLLLLRLQAAAGRRPEAGHSSQFVALSAALMFAVHPVSGVAVNYICIRDLLLAEVFLLAALLAYVRLRRLGGTPLRWAVAVVLLALSLLSKEIGVVAPLLVLAYEFTLGGESPLRPRAWLRAVPFAAAAAAFFAWTRLGLKFSDVANAVAPLEGTAYRYALTQARLHLFHYLRNYAWPFWMRPAPLIEPAAGLLDPAVLAGLLLVGTSLAAAWIWRRRAPLAAFAVLAYWISMAVESSVLPLFLWASDYRAFPAGAFLFLLVGLALERLLRRPWREVAAGALIVYFALASVSMNRVWRTEESLWTHSVAHGGDALAHLNLAMSLKDRQDPRVKAHLEEAVRMQPSFVLANLNLGLCLIDEGRAAEGLALCEKARDLEPGWAQTWHWLAQAYGRLGRRADAAAASRRAAELDPRNADYLRQAAFDAQAAGDHAGCLDLVRRLGEVQAPDARLLFLKGFSQQKTGDRSGAEASYRASLRLDPAQAQVAFNLAYALMEQGRFQEAAGWFRRALELKPDYNEVHYHLSRCYEHLANPPGAAREMELYRDGDAAPVPRK